MELKKVNKDILLTKRDLRFCKKENRNFKYNTIEETKMISISHAEIYVQLGKKNFKCVQTYVAKGCA